MLAGGANFLMFCGRVKWSGKLDSDRPKKTVARRVENNAKEATALVDGARLVFYVNKSSSLAAFFTAPNASNFCRLNETDSETNTSVRNNAFVQGGHKSSSSRGSFHANCLQQGQACGKENKEGNCLEQHTL